MEQQLQLRDELGYGYDSRYANILEVMDDVIFNAEHGCVKRAEKGLQHLLNNTMDHARAENGAMLATYYPERTRHELDHVVICKTIAALCWRWSRSHHRLNDLYELREVVFHHIGTHDEAFELFLMGMMSTPAVNCSTVHRQLSSSLRLEEFRSRGANRCGSTELAQTH
ncbi:hypothetical protein E4633_18805 [Geomonas terrae]|uniref:Hemerythrin-like domain-containing protein n=1 Tax=Geomonas terrae TaxID=2562681 RepID=A0A4S1CAD4_9BACT|nr:hypothetical protein [Geomonas terrae]TGU70249.1 hypothetical protein E4633_18805 [Geomonas terrae]